MRLCMALLLCVGISVCNAPPAWAQGPSLADFSPAQKALFAAALQKCDADERIAFLHEGTMALVAGISPDIVNTAFKHRVIICIARAIHKDPHFDPRNTPVPPGILLINVLAENTST